EDLEQSVDQIGLRGDDLDPGDGGRIPGAAVHLRVAESPPRAPGPLDLRLVTADRRGVGVAFPGPGVNGLPCLLADAAEGQEGADGCDAGFLLEFASGRIERILVHLDDSLRNRPG